MTDTRRLRFALTVWLGITTSVALPHAEPRIEAMLGLTPQAPPEELASQTRPAPVDTFARQQRRQSRTLGATTKRKSRLDKSEDHVAGGVHWRVKTDAGAIHIWVPPGYDRATAGTVVYVHGYYTNSDGAWQQHALARQFKASAQNAIFIVPDAPSSNREDVKWPALTDLRRAITRANIKLPNGPTIVMGHSGAFRTVMQWVDHKAVAQVILLDALYGGQHAFDEFIDSGSRANHHKLIVVASDTSENSVAFAKKYPFAVVRNSMPASAGDFKAREKSAKFLYIKSQYGHMQIVTGGKVIPMLLRLTPLKRR